MPQSRNRAWADITIDEGITSSGGRVIKNLLVNAPTVDTLTAVRILGEISFHVQTLSEIEFMQHIDLGIGVASLEAFNVGVTALPDPLTSTEYPPRGWLYIARRVVTQSLPTGGTPTAMYRETARFMFDLRAARKIDKGILFLHAVNTNFDGTDSTVSMIGRVRALCLT